MARYGITIFLSAFLLFQVQPLVGKYILPWFGGTPAVWTTCMLFFQVVLLAGYAYAHLLSSKVPRRFQGWVHLALLVGSLALLPINPDAWRSPADDAPTWQILLLLAGTIGMPYFLLSSTGPLLQEGFRRNFAREPYRLYALSNVGSLLALVSYPFVFEPVLTLSMQAISWSCGYAAFVLCCGWCALWLHRQPALDPGHTPLAADPVAADQTPVAAPGWGLIFFWLGLAACGSVMLLATTNQVCQEVAVVPFLWIAPLAIYLLTFIICFDRERWYRRESFLLYFGTGAVLACVALFANVSIGLRMQLAVYLGTLFAGCMVCHGELVRSKPPARYLTLFYLVISSGGALGGMFVALVAPRFFAGLWEYHIGLVATLLLALVAYYRDPKWLLYRGRPRWAWGILIMFFVVLSGSLFGQVLFKGRKAIETTRNFYGVLTVSRGGASEHPKQILTHGQIEHGYQFLEAERRAWPTTYYGRTSGIGLAIDCHPKRRAEQPDAKLRVGVVGLGCGTLASYGRQGDYLRFYEINPAVVRLSDEYFSYRRDSAASVEVILGDARVQMEQELAAGQSQQFDVLAIDAFSSDAIPMHLLTRQCAEIYRQHLADDGLLCLHISNRYLDLTGVASGMADCLGWQSRLFSIPGDKQIGTNDSTWVVITSNRAFLDSPEVTGHATVAGMAPPLVWTDDYGSLRQVLKP